MLNESRYFFGVRKSVMNGPREQLAKECHGPSMKVAQQVQFSFKQAIILTWSTQCIGQTKPNRWTPIWQPIWAWSRYPTSSFIIPLQLIRVLGPLQGNLKWSTSAVSPCSDLPLSRVSGTTTSESSKSSTPLHLFQCAICLFKQV